MSKRIIFRCKCPSCENTNEFIRWSHSCSQNSYFYLDTFGDLTCNECHQVANLLLMVFACSNCNSCYKSFPDANNQLKTIINLIIKKLDLDDDDFKAELLYNIAIRYKKNNFF